MGRGFLVTVLLLLGAATAHAHGGSYRPPPVPRIPTGTPGRSIPGTGENLPPGWETPRDPSCPGGETAVVAAHHWSRWWSLNREAVLDLDDLRRARRQGMTTESGAMGGSSAEATARRKALEILIVAATESDVDVATGAIIALGRCRDESAIPLLLRLVIKTSSAVTVRESAAFALGMIGKRDREIGDFLGEVVRDEKAPVRLRAFAALGQGFLRDGQPRAVPDLAKMHADLGAAWMLALGLSGGRFRNVDTDPVIVMMPPPEGPWLRAHWAAGLAKLGRPRDALRLRGLLDDADPDVRRQAVLSLGTVASADAALNVRLARDEDSLVRAFAAVTLGELGTGLRDLKKAYRTGNAIVAPHAALGLGLLARKLEEPKARGALRTFLRLQLREHRDPDLLGALCVAAAVAGDSASAPVLREMLRGEKHPRLRGHAAVALSLLGTRTALPDLRHALGTARDPLLLGEVAFALGLFADREAAKLLTTKLRTGKTNLVRGAAASALGRSGSDLAGPELGKLLADPGQPAIVRAFAAVGLGLRFQAPGGERLSLFGAHLNHAMTRGAIAEMLDFF